MGITISRGCSQAKITLVEAQENPYKDIVGPSWNSLSPVDRFNSFMDKLKRGDNALSKPRFLFKVEGLPRHQFAQHVRARIGVTFEYSDPQERPLHYIPYTPVYDRMFVGWKVGSEDGGYTENPSFSVEVEEVNGEIKFESKDGTFTAITDFGKNVAKQLLSIPNGDWRTLRDYLPLCYEQPYLFEIEYKALLGQCGRRLCLGEEAHIVANHYLQKSAVYERFPLLGAALQATCTRLGKCLYAKNYTLSNAFGCLFSGCNYRFPVGTNYASFNKSCSDINTLFEEIQPIGIVKKMDSLVMPEKYEDLEELDKEYFNR